MSPEIVSQTFHMAIISLALLPVALVIVVGLLTPGRKGHMRTEKEAFHEELSLEAARTLYEERLEHEGFEVEWNNPPDRIRAHRRATWKRKIGSPTVFTHARNPLSAEIHMTATPGGVAVRLVVWMKSFIFRDTGEGRYVDETIERILFADLEREPPPVVPNISVFAEVALYSAVLMNLAPLLMLLPLFDLSRSLGLLYGMGAELIAVVVLLLFALFDIIAKPKEMTGGTRILAAFLLSLLSLLFGAALFLGLYGRAALNIL